MTLLVKPLHAPASTERGARLQAPDVLTPIATVAARLGITARALRHYEAIGLISSHRGKRSLRLYDRDTIEMLEMVSLLRRIGVPIAQIRSVMLRRVDQVSYRQALQDLLGSALLKHLQYVGFIENLIKQLDSQEADS